MSEPIGVGDLIEATISFEDQTGLEIVAGTIYRCVGVSSADDGDVCDTQCPTCDHTILDLDGLESDEMGWCAHLFRPISRRSDFEHFLETLKTPAPEELVIA